MSDDDVVLFCGPIEFTRLIEDARRNGFEIKTSKWRGRPATKIAGYTLVRLLKIPVPK